MKIKPAPGRAVRDPNTFELLPDAGREVKDSDTFWRRRLRDGDVVRMDAPPAAPPVKAPPPHHQNTKAGA